MDEKIGGAGMFEKKLALHETLEFHEVINFKTVCLLKSKTIPCIILDLSKHTVLKFITS